MFEHICKDIVIVELASVLAGPSVGAFFAEFGATVIKVENASTHGDVTRSWKTKHESTDSDLSSYFASVNFGKKSITINLTKDDGRTVLYDLIKHADIVISSYKKGDDSKLGVSYDHLKKIKENIIYGHITGYGIESERTGYDAIIQAESGYMSINGDETSAPCKLPVALMDVLAGHQLKEAVLMALWNREKTGKGSYIPISLFDSALSGLINQSANYLNTGINPEPIGSDHPNIVPYGTIFKCKDDVQIMFAVGNDKQFYSLLTVLNCEDIQGSYKTNFDRVKNKKELINILQERILNFNSDTVYDECLKKKIPCGIINTIQMALDEPKSKHMIHNQSGYSATKHSTFSNKMNDLALPNLAEHTEEILKIIGYSDEKITELDEKGIISLA